MKQSPVRVFLVLVFVFIGCFGVAYAAAGMLSALPAPAVGGTCGPSTASETALEALARPGSIGAGPEPPTSNVTAHHQWQTFVDQCQALADRRGLASLAILVISVVVAGVGLVWVLRRPRSTDGHGESLDRATGLPGGSGPDGPDALVTVGTTAAPPGVPFAGAAVYPPHQAFVPATPYPGQPYAATPVPTAPPGAAYPPQPGWPTQPPPPYASPYPAPPAYPTAPAYPPPPQPTAPPAEAPPPSTQPFPAPPAGAGGEGPRDEPGSEGDE
ncbi:MAG: hypothetical protein ABSF84_11670 [Acidimicrobiales bacterium]|jgi:hypothetical protein